MSQITWTTLTSHLDAPSTAGVYRYIREKKILYIGKAINLRARLASHKQMARLDERERSIVEGADRIEITETDTEFKALLLEAELIRIHKPQYNRAWKDDKTYLYITFDLKDPYPRPAFSRAHDLKQSGRLKSTVKYRVFGPFPNTRVAEEILRTIRRLIPFCAVKHITSRACFYSKIGLCNPCPADIKRLPIAQQVRVKRQYRKQIRQVIRILSGQIEPVIKELTTSMNQAAHREEFESALELRTRIERFKRNTETRNFGQVEMSYNTSSTKLKALHTLLTSHFDNLGELRRIECYDASNSALFHSTVSLVVATDGLLDRGQYRRFKIKDPRARSDFDRLTEAMMRRLKRVGPDNWPKPDLVVIDGGAPQVRKIQQLFDQLPEPIAFLGLAKRPDRLILPTLETIRPPGDNPGMQLLQSLRDEAHRFANKYRKILDKRLSFNG